MFQEAYPLELLSCRDNQHLDAARDHAPTLDSDCDALSNLPNIIGLHFLHSHSVTLTKCYTFLSALRLSFKACNAMTQLPGTCCLADDAYCFSKQGAEIDC